MQKTLPRTRVIIRRVLRILKITTTTTTTTFLLFSSSTTTTATTFLLFSILRPLVSFVFFSKIFYKRLPTATEFIGYWNSGVGGSGFWEWQWSWKYPRERQRLWKRQSRNKVVALKRPPPFTLIVPVNVVRTLMSKDHWSWNVQNAFGTITTRFVLCAITRSPRREITPKRAFFGVTIVEQLHRKTRRRWKPISVLLLKTTTNKRIN